jgi:hypothetical protein
MAAITMKKAFKMMHVFISLKLVFHFKKITMNDRIFYTLSIITCIMITL